MALSWAFQDLDQSASTPNVALDRVTFGTLINGLAGSQCREGYGGGTRATGARVLMLWAEMRNRGIEPDDGIVNTLMAACHRHFAGAPPEPHARGGGGGTHDASPRRRRRR